MRILPNGKKVLSTRDAETVATYLNSKGGGRITVPLCRGKTPEEVARLFIGSKSSDVAIRRLADEIREQIGEVEGEK